MAQKFNQPQGSSPSKGNKPPVKKITPALLFSALFVAVSFIVMLIPLAIFNVSQVAAILGKRVAFLLMLVVSLAFILFGKLFANIPLIFTGVFVLAAIPFFMSAIAMREKKRPWFHAAIVLFMPVLFIFGFLAFIPPKLDHVQFGQALAELQQNVASSLPTKGQGDPAAEKAAQDSTKVFSQYIQDLNSSVQLSAAREFIGYSSWQRLGFFVFGMGASFFLLVLLISFANVVFVDFGFEQIERLRAIVNYVRKNPAAFSAHLTSALFAMPMVRSNRLQTPILITQHSSQNLDNQTSNSSKLSFLSTIWKPLKPKNVIHWQGYSFQFEGKSPWSLREFSLPFPIACIAIAVVGTIGFWYGNLEAILSSLQDSVFAPFIAVTCVLSFISITIVALQGMFTVYKRVAPLLVLVLMVALLYLGSKSSFGPYTILAVFGAVGLLDYVYDWRGRKA
jgi:hypothetical protein